MTKHFDKFFYSIVAEARPVLTSNMRNLPDQVPYGFWISPTGSFIPVKPQMHIPVAYDIIDDDMVLKREFGKYSDITTFPSAYDFMFKLGWIRVVHIIDTLEGSSSRSKEDLSNSSKKTLKDLASFYRLVPNLSIAQV
jgi:hypothetical protein